MDCSNPLRAQSSPRWLDREDYELGAVMGSQESLSSFARILGPLTGGYVSGPSRSIETAFRLSYCVAPYLRFIDDARIPPLIQG